MSFSSLLLNLVVFEFWEIDKVWIDGIVGKWWFKLGKGMMGCELKVYVYVGFDI